MSVKYVKANLCNKVLDGDAADIIEIKRPRTAWVLKAPSSKTGARNNQVAEPVAQDLKHLS